MCANLPPGLESATVEGTSLVLTYTEDLDTRSVPLPGAYSVTVAGGADPAVSSVSVSGTTVTLTLADPVTAGQVVTVTYTPGSNPVQDGSGLDALPLTGEEVDNTKPRRSRRAAGYRQRATNSPSPSTRPSTSGRASSPRRAPSPSRPTATR